MAVLNTSVRPGKHRGPAWFCRALTVLLGLWLFNQFVAPARAEVSREYQVKAAFLFNFTQFIKWPTNAFGGANAPLTIGVLGTDPFGSFLDETVRGETANGHPIIIKRFNQAREVKGCQILFVSRSEAARIKTILAQLKDEKMLTVSDIEGFAKNGGSVRLVTEHNKIHFRINLEVVKEAGLMASSQLLRLAEIVEPGKD